jgi:hypothetical protein
MISGSLVLVAGMGENGDIHGLISKIRDLSLSNYGMKLCSVCMTGLLLIGMMHPCYAKPIDRTYCELKQQKFLQHLQNAERDLAIARTQFMDEHPRVKNLERQRKKFTKLLKQNLEYCSSGQSKTPISSPSESIMGL